MQECEFRLLTSLAVLILFIGIVSCSWDTSISSKNCTITLDSAQRDEFAKRGAKVKYLSDNGFEIVEYLNSHNLEVQIKSSRQLINIGFQDGTLPTQNLILSQGDHAVLHYSENGTFSYSLSSGKEPHPFDIDYQHMRDSILFKGHSPTSDEFFRVIMLIDVNHVALSQVPDVLAEVMRLKPKAFLDIEKERSFLDSLLNNNLISQQAYEYYQIETVFDSSAIAVFPNYSSSSISLPVQKLELRSLKFFNELRYLVIYDDWLNVSYKKIFLPKQGLGLPQDSCTKVFDAIVKADLQPEFLKEDLLVKHAIYTCKNSSINQCDSVLERLQISTGTKQSAHIVRQYLNH